MATMNGDEYSIVLRDRQDLQQKLEAAASESDFLSTYYARMLRACEVAYQQAVNANVVLERQERRKAGKRETRSLEGQEEGGKRLGQVGAHEQGAQTRWSFRRLRTDCSPCFRPFFLGLPQDCQGRAPTSSRVFGAHLGDT